MKNIELLAPAGNFSSFEAAIKAGANSIYLGIEGFNMRSHSANNFKLSDLLYLSERAKEKKIKLYLTLNIVIYDMELEKIKEILLYAKKVGIDAIIAFDFAVIKLAREIGLSVHISTQANISNIEAVKFYAKYADVMVLARELSLKAIRDIIANIQKENIKGPSQKLVKIELFVHGAMCIAISGKCYMSLSQYNKSANRGKCLQACRREYLIIEKETGKSLTLDNNYIMSPKDLCTISVLEKIIESGVLLLKIEGRARSAEYVFHVVSLYKKALEKISKNSFTEKEKINLIGGLKKVFNRGFWNGGYYLDDQINIWSKVYGSKSENKKIYVGKIKNYFSKKNVAELYIEANEISLNDSILIIGNKTGVVEAKLLELKDEKGSSISSGRKKMMVTFPLNEKVRKNDKLYINVSR